jgi:hypothetical protein
MSNIESKFVAITYTAPASKLNKKGKAAREQLETAIHRAVEEFHNSGYNGYPYIRTKASARFWGDYSTCSDCILMLFAALHCNN